MSFSGTVRQTKIQWKIVEIFAEGIEIDSGIDVCEKLSKKIITALVSFLRVYKQKMGEKKCCCWPALLFYFLKCSVFGWQRTIKPGPYPNKL